MADIRVIPQQSEEERRNMVAAALYDIASEISQGVMPADGFMFMAYYSATNPPTISLQEFNLSYSESALCLDYAARCNIDHMLNHSDD